MAQKIERHNVAMYGQVVHTPM